MGPGIPRRITGGNRRKNQQDERQSARPTPRSKGFTPEQTQRSDPAWFGFLITLRENAPCSRVDLLRYLDQHKIGTRLLFAGNVTRQPYMKGRKFRVSGELAVANVITERSFWIGLYPGLSTQMLDHAAGRISEFLGVGL